MSTTKNKILIWGIIAVVIIFVAFAVQKKAPPTAPVVPSATETSLPAQLQEYSDDTNGQHLGRIASIGKNAGNAYMLTIDYATLTDCSHDGSECPNDYRIENPDTTIRSFYVNHDANVVVQTYPFNSVTPPAYNRPISLDDFITLFNASDQSRYPAKSLYYWITIKDDVVTDIAEQYQP